MSARDTYEMCKCCAGTGVQTRNDGIRIKCPACNGTGNWNDPSWKITWNQWNPEINRWTVHPTEF